MPGVLPVLWPEVHDLGGTVTIEVQASGSLLRMGASAPQSGRKRLRLVELQGRTVIDLQVTGDIEVDDTVRRRWADEDALLLAGAF